MTSSPTGPSHTDRAEVIRRNWAGEPALLHGENASGYDELLAQVRRALVPRDVVEEIWTSDFVDLAWDHEGEPAAGPGEGRRLGCAGPVGPQCP